MPPLPSDAQRRQLFADTVRDVGRRLAAGESKGAVLSAVRWGLQEMERTYASTPAPVLARVACRAGCGHCCSSPVDVQAHEVFSVADHIQKHFSPQDLEDIIARTGEHRAFHQGLSADERERSRVPCVFLLEGSCAIYEGRPEICRAHHMSDVAPCIAFVDDPDVDLTAGHIPELRARMYAVMLGIDEALEESGYDERSYDFGSALNEALTNSLCLARWLRKKPAFPDNCLTPPLPQDETGAA
jgi:hypothetical protein